MIRCESQLSARARSQGARLSQAWRTERETPSSLDISQIGKVTLSVAMKRKHFTGSRSPSRRKPRLFQDLPLLAQDTVLAPELPQLLGLLAGQALALAGVDAGLLESEAERFVGGAELARDLPDQAAARADELDRTKAGAFQ